MLTEQLYKQAAESSQSSLEQHYQHHQNKQQQTSTTSQQDTLDQQSACPKLPTPVRSRSNSPVQETNMEVNTTFTDLPDFTFSFFENDSNELANLSNTLGANLSLNDNKEHEKSTPQYRIKRASEILQSSLRTSSLTKSSIEPAASSQNEELKETRSRLKELETNYKVLQVIN